MNEHGERQSVYLSRPLVHQRETRVLHLEPAEWRDEIRCKLEVVDLDSKPAPAYEAISYVWGSQEEAGLKAIRLDGHEFRVGINLYSALRHLRSQRVARVLWADAICIDQSAISERNKQVGLMRDIYATCQGVLIWLGGINGEEPTESDAVAPCFWNTDFTVLPTAFTVDKEDTERISDSNGQMKLYYRLPFALRHGIHIDSTLWAYCFMSLLAQNKHVNSSEITILSNADAFQRVAAAISELMKRPWWQREWVIQEVVVPPRATVYYGRFVAPWDMFAHAARNFEEHRRVCCTDLYTALNYEHTKALEAFSRSVVELDDLRLQWRRSVVRVREAGDQLTPKDASISLRQLLWRFRSRDVTDAKDKIFGLLTLVNDGRGTEAKLLDYRSETQELYRATVEQIFSVDKSLLILSGSVEKTAAHMDLPTWVPDWCFKPLSPFEGERLERMELYNASSDIGESSQFVGNGFLGLKGGCFDKVAEVSPCWVRGNGVGKMLTVLAEWRAFITSNGSIPLTTLYPTGETRMAAYWRTLCVDTVRAMRREETKSWSWTQHHRYTRCPPDYVAKSMRLWMNENMIPHTNCPEMIEEQDAMAYVAVDFAITSAIKGRRLFTTEKGYLGLGPAAMAEGDLVQIMAGGHTPFVTRRIDKHKAIDIPGVGKQDCLSLIGDCYVHGIMDGEALNDGGIRFFQETIWLA
ncbi:hypothetical protein KVR01_005491 [Diaporthe batatas]|uniref:uncharacterized protein n=1 Tax=Diaporthe batatas TaxID=748121 RepID=UPI001D03C26E|nr:uncharacterized protein KVR01_005491 [Diaporthe batatas]KAG8165216.1 hypothetical protein KVR01_005491 [Diaporthe batatas]